MGKCISETVSQVSRATLLLLENRVLNNSGPHSAVLLVAGLQRMVLLSRKRPALLAPGLLKE